MTSSLKTSLFATIFWAIVYILGTIQITEPITRSTSFAVAPLLYATNRIKVQIKNEIAIFTEARSITLKYKALQEQNLALRNEVAQLNQLTEENNKLREQLGAPELDKFKLVPAKIISKENTMTVVYDKNEEVTKGAVVVYKNNFIGRVIQATNRSASIALVTDPSIQMAVNIINNDKKIIKGISSGQFGTGITVDRIEQNENIAKGNLVVLDKSPGAPAGIVVGEVTDVVKIESDLFQRAKINSFVAFDALDMVFIIQ
jgi:rod shape-determining protein MreC